MDYGHWVEVYSLIGAARGRSPEGRIARITLEQLGLTASPETTRISATAGQLDVFRLQDTWQDYLGEEEGEWTTALTSE